MVNGSLACGGVGLVNNVLTLGDAFGAVNTTLLDGHQFNDAMPMLSPDGGICLLDWSRSLIARMGATDVHQEHYGLLLQRLIAQRPVLWLNSLVCAGLNMRMFGQRCTVLCIVIWGTRGFARMWSTRGQATAGKSQSECSSQLAYMRAPGSVRRVSAQHAQPTRIRTIPVTFRGYIY